MSLHRAFNIPFPVVKPCEHTVVCISVTDSLAVGATFDEFWVILCMQR